MVPTRNEISFRFESLIFSMLPLEIEFVQSRGPPGEGWSPIVQKPLQARESTRLLARCSAACSTASLK